MDYSIYPKRRRKTSRRGEEVPNSSYSYEWNRLVQNCSPNPWSLGNCNYCITSMIMTSSTPKLAEFTMTCDCLPDTRYCSIYPTRSITLLLMGCKRRLGVCVGGISRYAFPASAVVPYKGGQGCRQRLRMLCPARRSDPRLSVDAFSLE